MPVYFNSKNLFTIPRDEESDISDNELYLEDPEMLFDRLPQPFRFINKIVNKICSDSWSRITEINNLKLREMKSRYIDSIETVDKLPEEESVQCMCVIESNQVLLGLQDGLSLWNVSSDKMVVLDKWKDDNINVSSMMAYQLVDNVYLVAIICEDGSARLVSVILGRMYFIREFPAQKDNDKPAHITNIVLDPNCGVISLAYTQIDGAEHWLEVSKINREAWVKEIWIVQRAYQEYLNNLTSEPQQNTATDSNTSEPSAFLDRNAIKVSVTNVVMKMKFPDIVNASSIGNMNLFYKQVDGTSNCIGLGLNHCITKTMVDARMKASVVGNAVPSKMVSHLLRIANVRYLKTGGNLIAESSNDDATDKEYSMLVVWWSQSQHLLMYGLNKPALKDPWVKPDAVRTFSCPISVCELSHDGCFITIGLENGLIILIDINSGLTKSVTKISNYPIKSIHFLHYHDSDSTRYMNVIDDKHTMYCVTYSTSLANSNVQVTSLESDTDTNSLVAFSRCYDLALSIYREGPMVLRDMFSGTAILRMELPDNSIISSPWQPILVFVADNYLCIQALTTLEEGENQPSTLLYKLDLLQFKYDLTEPKTSQDPIVKSYVMRTANDYLAKRHGSHNFRQNRLQDCFVNLSQYLMKPSTVAT